MLNMSARRSLLLLLGGAAAISACSSDQDIELEVTPRPVKMIEITASSDIRNADFPAIIEASESVELSFQVPGLIESITVSEGDKVSKGEVIARLDQRDFRNNLATAQAEFETADLEYERGLILVAEQAIAESVQDQRRARRNIAEANLSIARKALEETVLRSPFNGDVAIVRADEFQNIGAQVPIVTLQTSDEVEAVVEIPSTLIANSGRIEILENTIELDVAPGEVLNAEISETARQADPTTQTYEYKFAFDAPEGVIVLPGMTGTVSGKLKVANDSGGTDRIEIPLHAIVATNGQIFVWLVDENDMTVTRHAITTSSEFGENLRVESGLKPGDVIVGAGAAFLNDGMRVRRFEY